MNIADILENLTLADWEETSLAYCNLMLIKQGGGGRTRSIGTAIGIWTMRFG